MSLTAAAVALMISAAAPQADLQARFQAQPETGPQGSVPGTPPVAIDAAVPAPPAAPVSQIPISQIPATTDKGAQVPADPGGDVIARAVADAAAADDAQTMQAAPAEVPADGQGVTQGADIIVSHRRRPPPGDPMERINAESFKAVQAVDKAVLEPVATVYNKGLPRPVRQGLRNFFVNLDEPVVFVAYLLEFKPGKAVETAGRFLINSTLGLAGLIDVAKRKPFNLPYRPNGLANVLGYYGVGPGPYMYLPLIGPTTVRDLIGDSVDNLLVPAVVGKPLTQPEVATSMVIVSQLGERAAFDEEIRKIRKSDNPYGTYRDLYLKQRQAEIDALHGRKTIDVVPVYGPGMRTAGGRKGDQGEEPQDNPFETTPKAPAQPTDQAAPPVPATGDQPAAAGEGGDVPQ